jgi:EmrB/QacA subfamily drug resistance transporter
MEQAVDPSQNALSLTQAQTRIVLVSVLLAVFLGALDQAIVTPALSTIGRDLDDFDNLAWVVTAYLLTGTAVTPIFGKLGDIYGRRLMMLIAIWIFLIGSVACALSGSMLMLILSRALQGLGGGGILSIGQAVQGDILPPRLRGQYQIYFSAVFIFSSLSGPVLGGVLSESIHWSAIFWINVPVGLVALALNSRLLKLLPRHERRHKIDYVASALMITATVSLLLALTWGGRSYAWSSPQILGLFAWALVGGVAFAYRLAVATEPFIALSTLGDPVIRNAFATGFFTLGTMTVINAFMPLYFDTVRGMSPAEAGALVIPMGLGGVLGSFVAGRWLTRSDNYKLIPAVGIPAAVIVCLLMAIAPGKLPLAADVALTFVYGLGIGAVFPVNLVAIQNAAGPHQMGTVTGANVFIRQLGASILVTVFGVILLNALGLPANMSIETAAQASSEVGQRAFAGAYRWFFAAAIVTNLIGGFFFLSLEARPLRASFHPPSDSGA